MLSVPAVSTPTRLAVRNDGAAGCESVQEIINVLATAEAFAVTMLGVALESAAKGQLALDAEQQQALQAARAQDQAHYAFLTGMGAKPSSTTFTLPDPKLATDVPIFLTALIALKETCVAAYLAASQEFAILGEPKLAAISLAAGAVEAEHRVAVRFYAVEAGVLTGLPNDIAFEQAKFARVGAAATTLAKLGFIGGAGSQIAYPGPGAIDNTGVTNLRP